MNMHLPNGAAGFFPAPTNHIEGDPTPLDEMADLVLNTEIGPTLTEAMRDLN